MRILIAMHEDAETGGVASVVRDLARYLENRGHMVLFFNIGGQLFPKKKTTRLGFPGYEVALQLPFGTRPSFVSLPLFFLRFPIGLCQLLWLLHRNRIDVVNIHYPLDSQFYFAISRRILRFSLATSVHGADLFPGGRRRSSYSRLLKWVLSSSDLIVAPSRGFMEQVRQLFPILKHKTVFIYNGADFSGMEKDLASSAPGRGYRYILSVSACKEQKGLDVLIRAFSSLRTYHGEVKLLIVGDGLLKADLQQLAVSLQVDASVEFLGTMTHPQVARLLHECEVFVLPSRFETFGISIIEAMGCAKPVVASRVGGIPEIISDRLNGILVEPEDHTGLAAALQLLLENPDLRATLGKNALDTARTRFSSTVMGMQYERAFQALCTS